MTPLDDIRDEALSRLALSDVVGPRVTWDRRRSVAARGDWWAPCPFHQEKTPSFHVQDGKGFYYCFGCHAGGDAIAFLRAQDGLDYRGAVAALADLAGVEMAPMRASVQRGRAEMDAAFAAGEAARVRGAKPTNKPHLPGDALRARWREGWFRGDRVDAQRRTARDILSGLRRSAEIWRASRPDLPVLREYLAARGVDVDVLARLWRHGVPPVLRCHPDLPYLVQITNAHGEVRSEEAWRGPAMIGLIAAPGFHLGAHSGEAGIHRTWIDGAGRQRVKGVGKLAKRMMGATGHIAPVPIRITAHTRRMIVGEGIETVLALWSRLTGRWLDAGGPFWSAEVAKSRGSIAGADDPASRGPRRDAAGHLLPGTLPDFTRPGWMPPDYVDELVILAEGSARAPIAAERIYERARARHVWRRDGSARQCSLRLPGRRWDLDLDFADLAAREAARDDARDVAAAS